MASTTDQATANSVAGEHRANWLTRLSGLLKLVFSGLSVLLALH